MKQFNKQKHIYTLDTPVDVLHLSLRPANVLRNNNINTIGQLVQLVKTDRKALLSLRNLGKTSAEEIFSVIENIEIVGIQKETFADSIDSYNFSKRARTVFEAHNIKTISDLRKYSLTEIKNWKNIGKQTLDEIIDVLSSFDTSESFEIKNEKSICAFVLDKAKLYSMNDRLICDFNFSKRTLNVLESKNIKTIEELRKHSLVEIKTWRNVGQKTIDEIVDALSSPTEEIPQSKVNICFCVSESVFSFYTISVSLYEKILNKNYETVECLEQFLKTESAFLFTEGSIIDVILVHKDFINSDFFKFCENILNLLNDFLGSQKLNMSQILLLVIKCILLEKIKAKKIYNFDKKFCKILCKGEIYVDSAKKLILENLKIKTLPLNYLDISSLFPKIIQESGTVEVALSELEKNKLIKKNRNETYEIILPSIVDYIKNEKDAKIKDILERKIIKGQSLEEIGLSYNISRERVRQIIFKNFNKKIEQTTFAEDKYAFVFQKYKFKREHAKLIFGDIAAYYFSTRYESGNLDLEEILDDKSVPQNIRKKIQKEIIYTDCIYVGNQYVKKYRPALYRYYIRRYCTENTEIETFIKEYYDFCEKHGIEKEIYEIKNKVIQNQISQMRNVLYKYPMTFRYYDFEQYDFSELLDTLNLSQYENVLLSSAKFVKDYPALMKKYDIRDEYELHSLLRALLEGKDSNITFHRMPAIEFGKANINNQVLELLNENAPISPENLSLLYEEKYGTQAASVRGSYFNCISKYLHKSLYTIDLPSFSASEFAYLKQQLLNDFYTFAEVKQIFAEKFSDLSHINPMTLKELGFIVNEDYIIQGKFESAVNYFKYLLTKNEKIDYFVIQPAIRNNVTFNVVLNSLLDAYDLLEYDKKKYINFSRFAELGITKDDFSVFCERVYELNLPEYFSLKQIKNTGLSHKLFDLGFDDWFYAKILAQNDKLYSSQQIGGRIILSKGNKNITWVTLLKDIISGKGMDIYRLADKLNSDFGMKVDKNDILARIDDSDMYYDKIMEKLYRKYDDYFEEM